MRCSWTQHPRNARTAHLATTSMLSTVSVCHAQPAMSMIGLAKHANSAMHLLATSTMLRLTSARDVLIGWCLTLPLRSVRHVQAILTSIKLREHVCHVLPILSLILTHWHASHVPQVHTMIPLRASVYHVQPTNISTVSYRNVYQTLTLQRLSLQLHP